MSSRKVPEEQVVLSDCVGTKHEPVCRKWRNTFLITTRRIVGPKGGFALCVCELTTRNNNKVDDPSHGVWLSSRSYNDSSVNANFIVDKEKYRVEAQASCFNPVAVGSSTASFKTGTSKITSLDPSHRKMTGCLTKLCVLPESGHVSLPA